MLSRGPLPLVKPPDAQWPSGPERGIYKKRDIMMRRWTL